METNPSSESFLRSQAFVQSLLLAGIFLVLFLPRLIPAPFLTSIEEEFGLTHAESGRIFLYMAVGYGLGLICSGFAAQRLTHRGTVILAVFGVGTSMLLVGLVQHFLLLKLMLALVGGFCGMYVPSGISVLTSVVPERHWGKGLGVHETAPNSSFFLAPLIAAVAGGIITWRPVYASLGVAALLMGIVFLLRGRGGNFHGEAPGPRIALRLFSLPQFWILVILFTAAASIAFGSYSILPLYLESEHGLSQSRANQLLSLSRIPCLAMVLASGYILDRIGSKRTILAALITSGSMTVLIGLLQGVPLQAAVLLQPLLIVAYFPAGFAALSDFFHPETRNLAISLIIPMSALLGTGVLPAVLGWLADLGLFPLGFVLHGAAVLVAASAVRFFSAGK